MVSDLSQVIKAGTLLVIGTGEYSDSSWHGPVRVLKDFAKHEVADLFRAAPPTSDWNDAANPSDFLPWLVKEGYVEDISDCTSWHVGSYGSFEP